jgi:hypothetical protein
LKARNPRKNERVYVFGPAQYAYNAQGPDVVGIKITNTDIVPKIISGECKGLSPAYIVRKWECSICHGDLEECPHEVGKKYDSITCQMIASDVDLVDISVVDVPKDPRCRIIDMLIVKNGKNPEYIWYGFRVNTELDRFRNIQRAYEKGLIPEKAAFFFSKFFAINSEGEAVFS